MSGIVLIPVGGPSLTDLALPYLVLIGVVLIGYAAGFLHGRLRK